MPISGRPEEEVEKKINKAKAIITALGHEPVSPLDLPHNHNKSWRAYMHEDINALMNCDGIYLCSGWQFSKGCKLESLIALEFGLEFFTNN